LRKEEAMKKTLAVFLCVLVMLCCAATAPAATSPVRLSHTWSAATENGTVHTVTMRVENMGDSALSDLTLSFAGTPPFGKAIRPITIAKLRPHETVTAALLVISQTGANGAQAAAQTLPFRGKCLDSRGRPLFFAADSRPAGGAALRKTGARRAAASAKPALAAASAQLQPAPGRYLFQWGARYHFTDPVGVAVDGSGNIYVADSSRVQKFDRSGNFLFATDFLSPAGNVVEVQGVAVDSAGNFYLTDSYSNSVRKYDTNGTLLLEWGDAGTGNGQFSVPRGVAVDSSGNVYVADLGNNRIQKFDSNGGFLAAWGVPSYPSGVAVDRAGNVYVTDVVNSRVLKYDASGTLVTSWEVTGAAGGNFNNPAGIAVDAAGNVYVANTDAVQVFDSGGHLLRSWGSYGAAPGQFDFPLGIAVDSSGNVYVADTFNQRVQTFDNSGRLLYMMASYGSQNGNFHDPTGVAIDAAGNVFVADSANNRIQKFDAEGNFLTAWGSFGTGNGQFQDPVAVAVDGSGNVYVADRLNNRIQKFDNNGNFLAVIGSGQFGYPSGPVGVAADAAGNVFVADIDNQVVKKFDTGGNLVWSSAGCGSTDGFFPMALAVADSGEIFVADGITHSVLKLDAAGQCLPFSCSDGQVFHAISGVAVDAAGNVYALDAGFGISEPGRVVACDANGNLLGSFGSYGTGNGEFVSPTALAVQRSGARIYVADTGNNRIEVFSGFTGVSPAVRLVVSAPGSATAGIPVTFTVTAVDAAGNTATGYTGTVRFSSTDAAATLPTDASLINGSMTFVAILRTPGSQTITATDMALPSLTGTSNAIAVTPPVPDLAIAITHSGNFRKGHLGSFAINVSNVGSGATSGTVKVMAVVPKSLSKPVMTGQGWSCTQRPLACTTTRILGPGESYPPITLTFRVLGSAPTSVTARATVSGGGDTNSSNNTASDSAIVKNGSKHGRHSGHHGWHKHEAGHR
jgi:tripartite motif-containing protein 71